MLFLAFIVSYHAPIFQQAGLFNRVWQKPSPSPLRLASRPPGDRRHEHCVARRPLRSPVYLSWQVLLSESFHVHQTLLFRESLPKKKVKRSVKRLDFPEKAKKNG
jgi:hypothetical protein